MRSNATYYLNAFLISFVLVSIPPFIEGKEAKEALKEKEKELLVLKNALENCYPQENEHDYIILHRTSKGSIECGRSKKFYRPVHFHKGSLL